MYALHRVDYVILAVYFALTLVVGLLMTRRASSSLEHYFLAGRRLPWYLLGIAGMTNWFDLTGTMIITSFLFMLGPRGIFIEFRGGAVLILAFMLVYTGKWHRRSGCMTAAEWMTYRFGDGRDATAVRVLTAARNVLWTVGALGYLMKGTTLFMALAFPFDPRVTTAGIILIATIYTVAAGFYGVVLTDLLQGLIIMAGCFVVAYMGWSRISDPAAFAQLAEQVTGASQWSSSVPHWRTPMPPGYEQYELLLMFALFYLARNVMEGMGSGGENRYFGARSDRDCGLQSFLQGLTVMFRWPMMMGFAVLGILLVHGLYPDSSVIRRARDAVVTHLPGIAQPDWSPTMARIAHHPQEYPPDLIQELRATLGEQWPEKLLLVGYHGTVNPEQVLPAVLLRDLPAGLRGLLLVAMFAALMSTFTGTVNGAGALVVRDLYQVLLRPRAGQRELILVSYLSTIGIVLGAFYMSAAAKSINDIWGWLIMGLGAGGLAGLLRFYWWRCNAWGMVGGLALGGIGAVLQRLYYPDMVEWQQFLLMGGLSFLGTIGGSLLTPPTDMQRLAHFYRTTRPFGWWGPVRATFAPEQQRELAREHRNDIIAVPFALLWQITLFILPMQLVIRAYDSFWRTLPLFLVAVAGLYYFWYRNLPAAQPAYASSPEHVAPAATEP